MQKAFVGWRLAALAALSALACHGPVDTQVPRPITDAEQRARDAIRNEQALAARPLAERTVGVLPFTTNANDTTLGPLAYGLADLLLTDLAQSRRLLLVDRIQVDAFLRELSLVSSGSVDPSNAPRLGKLIQARQLILGSLTMIQGQQIRIDTRIAEVQSSQTGRPLAFSAPIAQVLDAEKALAMRLLEELGVTITAELRAAVQQYPTRVFPALMAYSRGIRYMTGRQLPEAAVEFELALSLDPNFVLARTRLRDARSQNANDRGTQQLARDNRRAAGSRAIERVGPVGTPTFADRPGGAIDLAFPGTRTTIIIRVLPQ